MASKPSKEVKKKAVKLGHVRKPVKTTLTLDETLVEAGKIMAIKKKTSLSKIIDTMLAIYLDAPDQYPVED